MKPKICKFEGCNKEVKNFPNSTIRKPYCEDHQIEFALSKTRKQKVKQSKVEKKEKTIELMSTDEYRAKYVQPIINEIARLIDYGQPCIATGSTNGKMAGGHFWSVGANRTICLNLHNIHIQSFHSNSALGGDNIRYREGIIKTYGIEYMEQIEALKLIKPIKLTKDELIQIKKEATKIKNDLKNNLKIRSSDERIYLRNIINEYLGIYGTSNRANKTD